MTPYCAYHDVLGAETNAAMLAMAYAQRPHFERSRVVPGRLDPATRTSSVVYDHRLREVGATVRAAIDARLAEAVAALGIAAFDPAGFEIQLTSHNNGEFFRRHTDAASRATATRVLSFVYYFHREPKAYSGGELVFFRPDGGTDVFEPCNDSLVLFDPRTPHEVRPIACPSGEFADGRFTLNGWLHRAPARRPAFAFDRRIFTPVGGWSPPAPARRPAPRPPVPDSERLAAEAGALRDLLLLYGDLHRTAAAPAAVDVRRGITGREFVDEYYSRNRPVLLPGLFADSDAVGTWTPEWFAERFGDEPVEITSGREGHPEYELRYRDTLRTVPMAEFVRQVTAAGESNDIYLVARNNFFDRAPFAELREHLRPPAGIVDEREPRPRGSMKLWFGPAGTVTPLHFDEHSILFVQVYGRKRFKLVPSFDRPRMYVRDRYYSEVDPLAVDPVRHPLFAGATVMDVEVGPGDALFLPVAWWHWARATSVSISATFSSFAVPGRTTVLGGRRR